ncbi:MAG TPA: glutaredoxin 3 [Candidatus Megaira endosymbiont of Nemacystus decipiens]|nr:glutaredoxin 3 [Candidatus Megaera endosymbiont of Nemacystus decipiens]
MKNVTIYTTNICPYCVRAKALLKKKNVEFNEINVEEPEERSKMMDKTNGSKSVPQIFIGSEHIGGCDDLYALEQEGKLDKILQ